MSGAGPSVIARVVDAHGARVFVLIWLYAYIEFYFFHNIPPGT